MVCEGEVATYLLTKPDVSIIFVWMSSTKTGEHPMIVKLFELKETLGIPGTDLLTRPVADRFVPSVHLLVKGTRATTDSIQFSFRAIGTADTSFIDQLIIVNTLDEMKRGGLPRRGIFLSDLSASTLDNAASVFDQKKIPILCRLGSGNYRLLGHIERNLASVLVQLMKKGKLAAVDLKKQHGYQINVASTKLNRLFNLGLATRKEEISAKGREYVYHKLF